MLFGYIGRHIMTFLTPAERRKGEPSQRKKIYKSSFLYHIDFSNTVLKSALLKRSLRVARPAKIAIFADAYKSLLSFQFAITTESIIFASGNEQYSDCRG